MSSGGGGIGHNGPGKTRATKREREIPTDPDQTCRVIVIVTRAANLDQGARQVRDAGAPDPPRSVGNAAGLPSARGPERRYRTDRDMETRPSSWAGMQFAAVHHEGPGLTVDGGLRSIKSQNAQREGRVWRPLPAGGVGHQRGRRGRCQGNAGNGQRISDMQRTGLCRIFALRKGTPYEIPFLKGKTTQSCFLAKASIASRSRCLPSQSSSVSSSARITVWSVPSKPGATATYSGVPAGARSDGVLTRGRRGERISFMGRE